MPDLRLSLQKPGAHRKEPRMTRALITRLVGGIFVLLLASCASPAPRAAGGGGGPFRLGVDVLAGNNWDLLRGKRVGLICNQTSMNGGGAMTRVAMKRAGVNLVALYAPEHGIDGTVRAGVHVSN